MDVADIMLKLDIGDLPNNIKIPKEAIDRAASLGKLFTFKALIGKGCYPRKVTGVFAVANGRLNIVRYMADMDYKFTDDHIKYARKGNHFDVLDFLLTFVKEDSPDCLPKLRRFRGLFNC